MTQSRPTIARAKATAKKTNIVLLYAVVSLLPLTAAISANIGSFDLKQSLLLCGLVGAFLGLVATLQYFIVEFLRDQ
ncbi:hypothetical protein E1162_17595 [Rhodobacteraceae bacterium RKSG542]|uniref:hypothetical protein n=1 Tax=Pseudovibrio flavus TaxID=2529854 RepID=UPI0012BCFBBB|nr:hypothetical protein [Pseudovibrio flavus]MTI19060.1 hypothetical protein [Pseudovibrio flavus]